MTKKEMRTFSITNLERRSDVDDNSIIIGGYASVFNSRAHIGNYFDEVIAPNAFSKTLVEYPDVRALFNHNWDKVLGRTKSGTLHLEEDERGLKFTINMPNTTFANDLAISMERGDINQCSFLFDAVEETWDYTVEPALRTVTEARLYEVSVVTNPAYEDTEASLMRSKEIDKSVEGRMKIIKQINALLEE